jgi:hypothetical protein
LMVIKTVASFTSRPLVWFSILCVPLTLMGMVLLGAGLWTALPTNGHFSLPLTGSGVIFLMAAVTLMASGTLGELVYKLGDVRPDDFARLTKKTSVQSRTLSVINPKGSSQ